jgi:hypothetical protein
LWLNTVFFAQIKPFIVQKTEIKEKYWRSNATPRNRVISVGKAEKWTVYKDCWMILEYCLPEHAGRTKTEKNQCKNYRRCPV